MYLRGVQDNFTNPGGKGKDTNLAKNSGVKGVCPWGGNE
jgi:hypothetical protein